MASTNDYGLQASTVLSSLGFSPSSTTANPDSVAIAEAINEFSGRVNTKLESLGVTPADINLTDFPNLFEDIRGRLKQRLRAWWHAANQQDVTLEDEPEKDFRIWLDRMREVPGHSIGLASHNLTLRSQKSDPATTARVTWTDKTSGFN